MKISSASKKVLASALSAAMVVAFSPAVAMAVNNGYLEDDVEHHFDAGTVTVASSCAGNGLMTYKCTDGDSYTVIASIAGTAKHSWVADTAVNGADANGFTWGPNASGKMTAALHVKCEHEENNANTIPAVVTKTGTEPSFFGAGEVTYTATARDADGKSYTSTKTVKSAAWNVSGGLTTSDVTWTDGHGVARVDISAGNNTQTLTATASSEAEPRTDEAVSKTRYTAEFELPVGVLFKTTGNASTYYIDTSGITVASGDADGVKKVSVKDGKLVVEAVYADETSTTAHIAATEGETSGSGADSEIIPAQNGNPETYSDNGVTITYTGEGKIADGTARADGVWTIETKCTGHAGKVVTEKTFADKVTKASCVKSGKETVSYTIEYNGGKFELKVTNITATDEADHHGYVAGKTQWSYSDGNFTATTEYYCPVEGKNDDGEWNERYVVTMSTNADRATGTASVKHNDEDADTTIAAAAVTDRSVKATGFKDGSVDVSLTLKRAAGTTESDWTALVDAIGTTPTASLTGVDPRVDESSFNATSNFVEKSSKATVRIAGTKTTDTKTYDLAGKHADASVTATNSNTNINVGYTVYSADITLPEGVTELASGDSTQVVNGYYDENGKWTYADAGVDGLVSGKSIYQNADGSYSVKYRVDDKVGIVCSGSFDEDGFLPTDAAKWTVSETVDGKSAAYVATAVATADVAHTVKKPNEQKAYTITYGSGKTVVVNATGLKTAHKLSLKTFSYDIVSETVEVGSDSVTKYNVVIKPVLSCSDCGGTVKAKDILLGTFDSEDDADKALYGYEYRGEWVAGELGNRDKGQVVYNDGVNDVDMGTYVFTDDWTSNAEFTAAPVFKWTSNTTVAGVVSPSVTATFTSADGKKEVKLSSDEGQIKVELVDAATGTYKATIKAECVPAGYKGELSDTKVVSLHDGHSMVLEKVEKATTSKAGFAQYYCNNDGKAYKVAIAKDDVSVTPAKKTFKYKAVKKAKQTVTVEVANAKGKVSFKSSSKKVAVNSKGVVTVKKGAKKGTYKVTVTSKATDTYAKATKTVKIVVK